MTTKKSQQNKDSNGELQSSSSSLSSQVEAGKQYKLRFRYKYFGEKKVSRTTEYLLFLLTIHSSSSSMTSRELSEFLFDSLITRFFSAFVSEKVVFDQTEWSVWGETEHEPKVSVYSQKPIFGQIPFDVDEKESLTYFDFQHAGQGSPSHFTLKFSHVPYVRTEAETFTEKVVNFAPFLTEPQSFKSESGTCTFRLNRSPLRKSFPEYGAIRSISLQYCGYRGGRKRKNNESQEK